MAWGTCFLFQEHVLPSIDLVHDHHVGEMVHLVWFQVNQSSALSTLQLVLNAPDFVHVLIKECFNLPFILSENGTFYRYFVVINFLIP